MDFSRRSRHAVNYAGVLAQKFGAHLDLLFVVEPPPPYAVEYAPLVLNSADLARRAKQRLERLARTQIPESVRVTVSIRRGRAALEIIAAAGERKPDLVVISTHGYTGVERVLLGSTAEQVIRRSPCPVLTLRDGTTPPAGRLIRRVMVPVDFSGPSRRALEYAVAFARDWGAHLTVFHTALSIPPPRRLAAFAWRLEAEALKQARHELLALVKDAVPSDVEADTKIVAGIPRTQILRAAERLKSDLIVMATHGRRGLERWVLGSTAEEVVRRAPCPVLVVRQPKRAR